MTSTGTSELATVRSLVRVPVTITWDRLAALFFCFCSALLDCCALDCGAFVAGLEYATSKEALIAGKPSAAFFEGALRSLGNPPAGDVAVIGDDLWSDVEGAQRAGLRGWLVRTGKFRQDVLAASGIVPDRILSGLSALTG